MLLTEEKFLAKDGKEYKFRTAYEWEAKKLLEYLKQVFSETNYLSIYPWELQFSIEDEKKFIRDNNKKDKEIFLVILDKDKIIGTIFLFKKFVREKTKHRCSIAISILKEYNNLGIGSVLLKKVIDIAASCEYEQIELEVVENNYIAISLYKKLGFLKYGCLENSMKLKDGTYLNEILMYKNIRSRISENK